MFPLALAWHGVLALAALCSMPLAAHAGWSVAEPECVLESEEISLFDGYADTRLRLSVTGAAVRVMTESNIDFGFDDVGLAVDGNGFVPADAVADEKDVLFSSGTGELIEQFIRGRAVTIYLRFWPTYPATRRYEARISLSGFTRAYHDYQACSSKLSS